ncbi:TonB-dependent receptor [Xylanibacter rodentium]|nr:TonB-dependent receptor [Xylanibacter rodentium]
MLRLLLCLLLSLWGNIAVVHAQNAKVTMKMDNANVKEVLTQIEKATDYIFLYQSGSINLDRKVSVNVTNEPLSTVLEKIFKDTGVTWSVKNRQISLKQGEIPASQTSSSKKKKGKHTLTGVVTDATNADPLIGASVVIKGGKITGTVTDIDGNFSLEVSSDDEVTFSYVGYKPQTLSVGDLGVLNVALEPDNNTLSEVVVVGAGTQAKVSVTGSIASVKGDVLKAPSSSLTSNFAGKLAGVISSTTSGEPGSVSEFYIRGVGTFGGRATPLILLDDVEISAADLNRLPAESIESFSILKDASATAIYGARGANGVMLITTKKGMENTRAKINVSLECSFLKPVNRVEYVDGPRWMEMYNEALVARTPSASPKYSAETIELTRSGVNPYVYPNVDWYDLMFKDMTSNQRANVNLTGGGSKVTYYMGLQVNHDSGILNVPKTYSFDANIDDWNYIFQNNICYKPTTTTTIDLHLNAQFGNRKGPGIGMTEIFSDVYNANPVSFPAFYPSYEGDEHIRFGNSIQTGSRLNVNPYAHMMSTYKVSNYSTINASLRATQKFDFITEGLSVTALVNMKSYAYSDYVDTLEPYYYRVMSNTWDASDPDYFKLESLRKGTDYISQGDINRYTDRTFYFDARINYNRQFNDVHNVSGMLMYMMREFRSEVLPNRNQGFSGRFTYDYARRYLLEVNFGYNGTERLAKVSRFELFPAVSLGWVPSNESWWESLNPYIDHLKVRGSYGLVGSDETGLLAGAAHFLYKNEVNLGSGGQFWTGPFHGSTSEVSKRGPAFLKYAVENAGWERAKKFDIGLDMSLFNCLNVTFDYFRDKRDRILQKRSSWPSILGYASAVPWGNVGKVDNQGIELSVNYRKRLAEDLSVDVRGNFTYTKNKYVYNDEPDYPYVWQTLTGKPLAATYGYIADGLFKDEADIANSPSQASLGSTVMPGDIKYRDVNGDGMINDDDKVMLSKFGTQPRIQYGFGVNVVWKKWDFGVFFNGSANRTLMINNIAPFCSDDGNQDRNVMTFISDNYWSASNPNPDAQYPRLGVSNAQVANNMVPSSYWMRNGSFIRFKTLELGYTLPFVRVYFSGDNLAVWGPFKYWDPELSYSAYPLHRTFNIGAQFTF